MSKVKVLCLNYERFHRFASIRIVNKIINKIKKKKKIKKDEETGGGKQRQAAKMKKNKMKKDNEQK